MSFLRSRIRSTFVIAALFCIVAAPRVFADSAMAGWTYDMDGDCSDSFDVTSSSISSACDGSGSSTGTSGGGIGGPYMACSAQSWAKQSCVDVVTLGDGTQACAYVKASASCQCKNKVTSGLCTYYQ